MQANAYSPYVLKDLHQAIDLIDRKIAHGKILQTFVSQEARETHLRKLSSKRAALVKSALVLTDLGVQWDPQFLPRSFIHPVQDDARSVAATPVVVPGSKGKRSPRTQRS